MDTMRQRILVVDDDPSLAEMLTIVLRQEGGGGNIYFDDVLVRENGRFVLPELAALNPENLASTVV